MERRRRYRLDRGAHQVAPLRPGAIIVAHRWVAEPRVQHYPGVPAAPTAAAVGDHRFVGRDTIAAVDRPQLGSGFESGVPGHRRTPETLQITVGALRARGLRASALAPAPSSPPSPSVAANDLPCARRRRSPSLPAPRCADEGSRRELLIVSATHLVGRLPTTIEWRELIVIFGDQVVKNASASRARGSLTWLITQLVTVEGVFALQR
jgi:hypothetical protein